MEVSISDAKAQWETLISAVEDGQEVVITRDGSPVAQITAMLLTRKPVRFGTMRGKIHLKSGCMDPITEEQFFAGDF